MAKKTFYIPDDDVPVVDRAIKLIPFYEDSSLSSRIVEFAREVVEKYDGKRRLK